jgi:hypothetical protein
MWVEQDRDTAYTGHLEFVEGEQHEQGVRMGPLYDRTIQFLRFREHGTFGVTIKSRPDRAPDITLYLFDEDFDNEDESAPRDRTFKSKAKNMRTIPNLVQTTISHLSNVPNSATFWDTDLTKTRGGIWPADLMLDVYGHVMVPKLRWLGTTNDHH